jgi:hypothetical protein
MLFFLLCTFMHQCDRYSIMGSTCQFKEHVRYSGRRTRVEPGQVMRRPVRLYLSPITLSKWIGWTIPVRARLSHRRSLSTKLDRRRLLVINGHPMSPHEKVEWPTPATTLLVHLQSAKELPVFARSVTRLHRATSHFPRAYSI